MSGGFWASLGAFCDWLETTSTSQTIQTVLWIVPTIQSIHILAIAALMGSALMIDARLLGWIDRDEPAHLLIAFQFLIWGVGGEAWLLRHPWQTS